MPTFRFSQQYYLYKQTDAFLDSHAAQRSIGKLKRGVYCERCRNERHGRIQVHRGARGSGMTDGNSSLSDITESDSDSISVLSDQSFIEADDVEMQQQQQPQQHMPSQRPRQTQSVSRQTLDPSYRTQPIHRVIMGHANQFW